MDSNWQLPEDSRNPLGELRKASNAIRAPASRAQIAAAGNLIAKAFTALSGRDRGRAEALVRRAAALPYEPFEGIYPVRHAVHMMLFREVIDALESEQAWLSGVETCLRQASEPVELEFGRCLAAIRMDYALSEEEVHRVDAVLCRIADPGDPTTNAFLAGPPVVADLLEVLEQTLHYIEAVDESDPEEG